MTPLISLGMPVYNAVGTVGRAIESLLSQSFTDFELVISDNASSDGTYELLEEYAKKDSRISLHHSTKNHGATLNFKKVLGLAEGTFFMWTAGDDYWHPECLKSLAQELEDNPTAFVALSGVRVVFPNGQVDREVRFQNGINPNDKSRLATSLLFMSSKKLNFYVCGLMRRKWLARNIHFLEMNFTSDRTFMCLLALAFPFRYVDDILFEKTKCLPYEVRYPHDPLGKAISKTKKRGIYHYPFLYFCKNIPRCHDIPIPTKLLSILLVVKSIIFGIKNTKVMLKNIRST